jgi:hypothetical protein
MVEPSGLEKVDRKAGETALLTAEAMGELSADKSAQLKDHWKDKMKADAWVYYWAGHSVER